MTIKINLIPKKESKEWLWKSLNIVVAVTTILNVSLVTTLARPSAANAATDAAAPLAAVAVNPAANPSLGQTCGLDIGLVVDTSGSVDSTEMGQMKTALSNFASAFASTPTVFSLSSFNTEATLNQGFSMTPAQAATAIGTLPASGSNNTNWDAGLARSFGTFDPRANSNLIVIATDGSPNRWDDPANATFDWVQGLDHAVTRANAIKTAGTRIVVVAIGADTADPDYDAGNAAWNNPKLTAISGPSIATTPGAISATTDVIKVTNFAGIGTAMAAYAASLCGGDLKVIKTVVGSNEPSSSWTMHVKANGTDAVTPFAGSPTGTTNSFAAGAHVVSETGPAGYTATFSGDCDAQGNVSVVSGALKTCTITNTRDTSNLTVNKKVDANGDGIFEGGNTEGNTLGFDWGVDGGTVNRDMGTSVTVTTGSHTVAESQATDYHYVGWYTTNSTQFSCANPESTANPASVTVGANGANITLCNARNEAPLTVNKNVDRNGDGDYADANETGATDWTWDVNAGNQNYQTGTSQDLLVNVTYSVNEDNQAGFHVIGWICVDDHTHATIGTGTGTTLSVTIPLKGATCTFSNARNTGTITVLKNVDVNGDGDLNDPVDVIGATNWSWNIASTPFNNETNIATGSSRTITTGNPVISENMQAGYHVVSMVCGASNFGAVTSHAVAVSPQGETCTFTNARDTGSLTINKMVQTAVNGSFTPVSGVGTPFRWGLDGQPNVELMGSTVAGIPSGTHEVRENSVTGYHFAGWYTTGSTQFSCTNPEGLTLPVNVSIAQNSQVSLTLCNARDTGGLIVKKQDANGSPMDVVVNVSGPSLTAQANTGLIGTYNFGQVPTDAYVITETSLAGYTATGWECSISNGGGVQAGTGGSIQNATVVANQTTTCTFTNARDTGSLIVHKQVLNPDGSINSVDTTVFTVAISGPAAANGSISRTTDASFFGLATGVYTVLETGNPNYATPAYDIDENLILPGAQVTIGKGQIKEVTVINKRLGAVIDVSKVANVASVNAGDTIVYTISWTTDGFGFASNAVITDTLPANTSFVSATCGTTVGTCVIDSTTNVIRWSLGDRHPSQNGTVSLTVKTASPLANGTLITNTAFFDTDEQLPVDDTVVTPVTSTFVVDITKTDSVDPVQVGANLTYTLAWSVSGNAPISNLVITDPIPANTSFVAASNGGTLAGGTVTWNLGPQSANATGSVTLTVAVAASLPTGTILTNTALVCADSIGATRQTTHLCDEDTETTTVVSAPSLSITKVNNVAGFTNPGQVVTYTVTVTNATTATTSAIDVILTDVLPAGFTFVDGGTGTKTFNLGTMAPGSSVTTTYAVNIASSVTAGTYTNTATAKGTNTNLVSASSNVVVKVPSVLGISTEPLLTITKAVSPTSTVPGAIVTYTLTVRNTGEADATNVVITDTLPDGFIFVDDGNSTKTWNLGTLELNHERVINYDVRVSLSVKSGTYENNAVLTADGMEPLTAKKKVTVVAPRVLGLATTGPSAMDYALVTLGLALMVLGGTLMLRRRSNHGTANA